jgi:TldD protein
MVNINLSPGEPSLEEMIADTKDGLYLSANRSWSIDDFRLNFQFGCEVGWEIKNGKLGNMVRDPVYTGITPQFWQSCDAISSEKDWQMWGWRFCGKGDPMQLMHVGHGCSPARFRGITVGAANVG